MKQHEATCSQAGLSRTRAVCSDDPRGPRATRHVQLHAANFMSESMYAAMPGAFDDVPGLNAKNAKVLLGVGQQVTALPAREVSGR